MGGSKTEYHERELSPEEKQLYAQQVAYMQSIQPGINALINKGMQSLDQVYMPDWNKVNDQYQKENQDILNRQETLLNGQLPESWTTAKANYYNRQYENTMGAGLAKLAQNGVINSSRMNTATNDWQKNLSAQMSKDYSSDVDLYNNLLNTRQGWLQNSLGGTIQTAGASRDQATDFFNAATGTQKSNTEALGAIGQNESNRGYVTQSSSGFGNFLGGLVGAGAGWFMGGKK